MSIGQLFLLAPDEQADVLLAEVMEAACARMGCPPTLSLVPLKSVSEGTEGSDTLLWAHVPPSSRDVAFQYRTALLPVSKIPRFVKLFAGDGSDKDTIWWRVTGVVRHGIAEGWTLLFLEDSTLRADACLSETLARLNTWFTQPPTRHPAGKVAAHE